MKKILPPLVLFFLAPAVGELLSSSAPPVEFFSPFGLTMLSVLYGGGAVLVRECVIRWRKGWVSLFLLGGGGGGQDDAIGRPKRSGAVGHQRALQRPARGRRLGDAAQGSA